MTRENRYRWRGTGWTRTRALLSLGMVLGLGAVGTLAAWTSQATAETGVFSVGAIQLKLDGEKSVEIAGLTAPNLAPGDTVAGMLDVQNTGSIDFDYVVDANVTDNQTSALGSASELAEALSVEVFAAGTASGGTCSGGSSAGGASALSTNGATTIIGTERELDAGEDEDLCFQVTFDSQASKIDTRMSAVSVEFEFTATEVTP